MVSVEGVNSCCKGAQSTTAMLSYDGKRTIFETELLRPDSIVQIKPSDLEVKKFVPPKYFLKPFILHTMEIPKLDSPPASNEGKLFNSVRPREAFQ